MRADSRNILDIKRCSFLYLFCLKDQRQLVYIFLWNFSSTVSPVPPSQTHFSSSHLTQALSLVPLAETGIDNWILSIDSTSWHFFSLCKSCPPSFWSVWSNLGLNECAGTESLKIYHLWLLLLCVILINKSDIYTHITTSNI